MSPSARHLLLSNAATLVAGLLLHWNVSALLWPYWMQSVIIGWYARKRMLTLDQFSTSGFTSNGEPEDILGYGFADCNCRPTHDTRDIERHGQLHH